jgi:type IV pilus assembly protein PilB
MTTTRPSGPPATPDPPPAPPPRARILGELLLASGAIRREDLDAALHDQGETGKRLGELLVERGACGEEQVARALATQLNLPYSAPPLAPDTAAVALLRPRLAREKRVLPLSATARVMRLAMADPLDLATVDDVQFQTGRRVDPTVAPPSALERALARAYGGELEELMDALPGRNPLAPPIDVDADALERAARAAPVVRLVDHLLARAVDERASDIHIEEWEGEVRVRYRVDGVLRPSLELPAGVREAAISRIKIMGGMDISVKLRPQDGGFPLRHRDRKLDVRASTLPVSGGEKAVLRLLDPAASPRNLEGVGLSPEDLDRLRRLLGTGHGVVLAAGPTGSGKSTTLFGALAELDRLRQNIVTLEDPIEYRMPGVNQVQVSPKTGLTFPAALRSVLRQDPDIVMVGEIRDRETAEIAMAAAITGHLVLSTIHTTDAPGGVTRLLNMGVPPFLLAGGLSGIVAQRLVRRLCDACGGRGKDCHRCSDGYRGRIGVFQLLAMSEGLREAVIRGAGTGELRAIASREGMGSMAEDGRRKVAEGLTTPHEVGRVLGMDPGVGRPCGRCRGPVPASAVGCPACGERLRALCLCGTQLVAGWRFCPTCLRPVPAGSTASA